MKKTFEVTIFLTVPVTVKGIVANGIAEADAIASPLVKEFFQDGILFGEYSPVDMSDDQISLSINADKDGIFVMSPATANFNEE